MDRLAAFLPKTLYPLVPRALAGAPAWERAEGTVLFCDVAGFTPLTEALAVLGKEGAEELTRVLNGYFSRMIGILEEEGGDVLRFGGDAMAVLFPGPSPARALRAAGRMMDAMAEFESVHTKAGAFTLAMKAGAASGEVQLGLLGDAEAGYDFYALGRPLQEAAEAEHHASAGLVVCHPSTVRAAGAPVFAPLARGFARLVGEMEVPAPPAAYGPAPPGADLRRLMPPYLADYGRADALGEHRGTAVLFAAFGGSALDAAHEAAAHALLGRLFAVFSASARRHGGVLNKLDMGDKGSKALLLFGSPLALEKREEMAVRAAMELQGGGLFPPGVTLRVGLTASHLFTGPIGSARRREFTGMGEGINRAARLMQAAGEGQILCDGECAGRAARAIRFQALPALALKGLKARVQVFEPAGELEREAPAPQSVLVEREQVQEALEAHALRGEGGPIALAGGAGTGKTALLEWALAKATAAGLSATRVPLGSHSSDRPFAAWRGPVRVLVGAEWGDPPERLRALRESALAAEPAGYRPLLNPLLNLPEERTPALANLSPKERKDLLFAMLARAFAGGGPRVLLVDNLHWADPLSLELLRFLLGDPAPRPWRLAVTLRPGAPAADATTATMTTLTLAPLSEGGVTAYLASVHGLSGLEPAVLAWFAERCRGNPGALGAFVGALERAGLVRRGPQGGSVDADRLFATSFPQTLESLYLARVDPLEPEAKSVLRHAAVLGVSVSVNLLAQLAGLERPVLERALDALAGEALLRRDSWGERPYVRFNDALLRDAVYEAAPFALKREAHLRLAAFLEPEAPERPRLWPVLADHYERAGEAAAARKYHRLAGRDAAARFDNVTALRHLEFVCKEITPDPDDVEDAFALMDVYGFLGRWTDARPLLSRLQEAEETLRPEHQARFQNYVAQDRASHQDWAGAEAALLRGIEQAKALGDVNLQGRGYVNLVGRVYGPTGRLDEARECLEKALALPKRAGQTIWRTTAAMNLGAVLKHLGSSSTSEQRFRQAFHEAARGQLGPQRAIVAKNLAGLFLDTGQFSKATVWGRKAVTILQTFALRQASDDARYDLALAYLANGMVHEARRTLPDQADVTREVNDLQRQAQFLLARSAMHNTAGELSSSLAEVSEALRLFLEASSGLFYRSALLGVGQLFYALDQPRLLQVYWERRTTQDVLNATAGEAILDLSLERQRSWASGQLKCKDVPEDFVGVVPEGFSEERLERLLWVCESAANAEDSRILMRYLPSARRALLAWPYFDARLRVLRIEAGFHGFLTRNHQQEALRMLNRSLGGIWGLRLLCLLAVQEKNRRSAARLRTKALAALDFVKAHSPPWAWDAILKFPEAASILGRRFELSFTKDR